MITNQQELNRLVNPMIETMTEDASTKLNRIIRTVGSTERAARLLRTSEATIQAVLRGNSSALTASLLVSILGANGEALVLVPVNGMPMGGAMPPMPSPFGDRPQGEGSNRGLHSRPQDIPMPSFDENEGWDDEENENENEPQPMKNWDSMTRSELIDELAEHGINIPNDQLLRMTRGEMIEELERQGTDDGNDEENWGKDEILDIMSRALDSNPELTQCFADMLKSTRR